MLRAAAADADGFCPRRERAGVEPASLNGRGVLENGFAEAAEAFGSEGVSHSDHSQNEKMRGPVSTQPALRNQSHGINLC